MRHKKLKIKLLIFGSFLFATGIIALCALIGADRSAPVNSPELPTIAAILSAAFLVGVSVGFLVKPKLSTANPQPFTTFARNVSANAAFSRCGQCATKRDTRIGGFVSPPRIAGRHGMRVAVANRFSVREFQFRQTLRA